MTAQYTHRDRLLGGSVLVVVAVTVVAGLLWGTWRLVSWAAVTGTHHPYGYAAGGSHEVISPMSGYTPGLEVVAGVSLLAVLLAVIAILLVLVVAMSHVGDYADDPLTALERAYVRGEMDDEEFVHQKRILTGEGAGGDPNTPSRQ